MESSTFEKELLKNIKLLSKEQQETVLVFVKSLVQGIPRARDKKDILKFPDVYDAESIKEMSAAIKSDCENIDKDGR